MPSACDPVDHWHTHLVNVHGNIFLSPLPTSAPPPHIRAVVSLLTAPLSSYHDFLTSLPRNTAHHYIPLDDTPDAFLLPHIPSLLTFLSRYAHIPTLIHCLHGTSRSVAAYLAYRLHTQPHIPLTTHLSTLRQRYPSAVPSPTFLNQLHVLQLVLQQRTPHTSVWPIHVTSSSPISSSLSSSLLRILSVVRACDREALLPTLSSDVPIIRCRVCRGGLDVQTSGLSASGRNDVIIVLPAVWMLPTDDESHMQMKRLRCPHCNCRIGTRVFNDDTVEFALTRSAVDEPITDRIAKVVRCSQFSL